MDAQRDTRDASAQRKDHVRTRGKVAIFKPRKEASGETSSDDILVFDFQASRTVRE